jgi:pimeloyl-ACP methyl ester carboxylesterase
MSDISSETLFLRDGETRVFASLHRARSEKAVTGPGLVVCPALTDEHIACYRVLYVLAERLSAVGVPVARFDPPGHGDSEGALEDATPERVACGALEAARALREWTGVAQVGFLGVRLGCAGALTAAAEAPEGFCVAWAPILSPDRYFRDLLRRQVLSDVMYGGARRSVDDLLAGLSDGDEVDVGGYILTRRLYDAYLSDDVPKRLAENRAPLLLVQRESASAGTPKPLMAEVAESVDSQLASDEAIFWQFSREGSLPPAPTSWYDATVDWIQGLRASESQER